MKQISKMSRLVGQFEKAFRILNEELFEGVLPTPIITAIPTPRAYAHYTPFDSWNTAEGGKPEINISTGSLDRPLENVLASLLHEMVHLYNDRVLNIQDVSGNSRMYHNKQFREQAEAHGLIVTRSEKYGWSTTEPGDALLDLIILHDELREIEICRTAPNPASLIGTHTGSGNPTPPTIGKPTHHRKYQCPRCGCSVRATKAVRIGCLDCGVEMVEA